ncbi:MAG: HD-GYP domain-containing protein [Spirochaetes bacterium]|nr:HD-GYP domain-containing protein [Spirochaetota bacterium]MBU1081210.1 HD-GYP domain-containing protein [Spirochaetota bacterium]
MNAIPFKELAPDTYYSAPVFLDDTYIILTPETPLTSSLINRLAEWEIRELFTEGEPIKAAGLEAVDAEGLEEAEAEGRPVTSQTAGDKENLAKVTVFYDQFLKYVETVYTRYVTKSEISLKELSDKVKTLCDVILENKRYVLRILGGQSATSNYLVNHSTRSTVLAIILGGHLKLPPHRLIELGVAAVLHEIGMVRLPPQLYMADRKLSDQERKSITAHPILGYNILKDKQFPLSICLAALEHHERMSGTGYPRALTGEKISVYARIIAVACSYDAVTASRPYKEAREGYAGMVDILKNEGKQYDDVVIKSLVYSLSVFPVGSFVLLTNSKLGQVIDVNPDNPRYPVVLVLGSKTPDGKETIVQTSETGVRILKPVRREDAEAVTAAKG